MKRKRLMLLGGLRYLLPVIDEAHKLGIHVITADYLPDNIAHKFSDEYCNVSIIEKEAVLKKARDLKIDGIMSFAVDPGVVSAAYVAENMGLPFQCSYESAVILQDKVKFREFLRDHGFACPASKGYDNYEQAVGDGPSMSFPVMVKPSDSAGSKGVSRVDRVEDLPFALKTAFQASHKGCVIVEDFLQKSGFSAGSESFVVKGKLMFNGFYDQLFDDDAANPYTPSAEVWPSVMPDHFKEEIRSELQRLFTLLEVDSGLFNVEFRACTNGKVYLMEVSPRAGGNRLAEMLNYAADVNIIKAETQRAVGLEIGSVHEPNYRGHFAISVLHADREGIFHGVEIDDDFLSEHVIEKEIRLQHGDVVPAFSGANAAIGTLFLRFDTRQELIYSLEHLSKWVHVKVL